MFEIIKNMHNSFVKFLRSCFCSLLVISWISEPLHGARSVSHYGITWSFSTDCITGVFANGEPWVVGPVTITEITPLAVTTDPTGAIGGDHGSMVNPIPGTRQAFEAWLDLGAGGIYNRDYTQPSSNIKDYLPYTAASGDAVVSSITTHLHVNGTRVDTICVLTVLASQPPPGSFRPGYFGTDRTIRFNKADINWSVLANLPKPSSAPSQAYIETTLPALPWVEWGPGYGTGEMSPKRNGASYIGGDLGSPGSTYGREIAYKWSTVALWLNLENTREVKEKAMIQTIQVGIDLHSYLSNIPGGIGFYADGGHKVGRKFPLFLAAVALNDPVLLSYAANPKLFVEDQCTFIVQATDVGRKLVPGHVGWTTEMIGMGEWGVKHLYNPEYDDSRFWESDGGVPYRFAHWPYMFGAVLAAEIMGKKAEWNHEAIFVYNKRFREKAGVGDGFQARIWEEFEKQARPSQPNPARILRSQNK